MPKQFEFCRVCRRNQNQGRGHRYSASHKRFLELLLGKLLRKIKEVRLFVKSAVPKTDGGHKPGKFWCDSCEKDIIEQGSLFERAETIKHLASQEHIGSFERFLAEHGGDVIKSLYFIEAADFSQWEQSCKRTEAFFSASLQHSSSDASNAQTEARAVRSSPENAIAKSSTLNATRLSGLSTVRDSLSKPAEGNVHTGAPPPWLKESVQGSDEALTPAVSESRPALFLSRTQERKLAKLWNPQRVGAAWAERKLANWNASREVKQQAMIQMTLRRGYQALGEFGKVVHVGILERSLKLRSAEPRGEQGLLQVDLHLQNHLT